VAFVREVPGSYFEARSDPTILTRATRDFLPLHMNVQTEGLRFLSFHSFRVKYKRKHTKKKQCTNRKAERQRAGK
jgi:hypothetical protein